MAVRPQRPFQGDLRSGRGWCMQGGWRGANDAASAVSAALDVGERDRLDGAVALDRSGNALWLYRWRVSHAALGKRLYRKWNKQRLWILALQRRGSWVKRTGGFPYGSEYG